jgi:hypothetical protein
VRIAGGRVGRQADGLEQLAHPLRGDPAAREAVHAHRLADHPADGVARVERGVRVLEDHLHPPPERAQLRLTECGDVLPVEDDPAGCRLVEPQDRSPDRRLAAAGLSDKAERLPALDRERDAVDGFDVADVAVHDHSAFDREPDLHVLELNERAIGAHLDTA